jgi:hypothetical protein
MMATVNTLNWRAARALVATFVLSFANLIGAFVALSLLGGLEPWTDRQFVGLFGLIELGMGIAYLFAPNIWRLPVAEANTPRTDVRLTASTVLIPHWIALAKALGGALMVGYAATEGIGPATLGLPLAVLLVALAFFALSVALARLGVARPDLDVFFVTVRRPGGKEYELPGFTITGMSMQLLSNFGVFPGVELLEPSALYRPELGPSPELLLTTGVAAGVLCAVAWLVWWGRITVRAPREQEREAEKELAAKAKR